MDCLILAAGYATRLYPLTKDRPKPLLPVGGVPILERIVESVLPVPELRRILVVTNHRFADPFVKWQEDFRARRPSTVPIEILDDGTTSNDDRLGAIGDIDFTIRKAGVDDDLMVIAGDNILDFNIGDFAQFARSRGSAACLKELESIELVSLYSVVQLDAEGRITAFEEKPKEPKSRLISIGLYYYAKRHVPLFQKYLGEGNRKDQPGYYLQWLHKQIDLYGFLGQGTWFDIGDLESYRKADRMMEERRKGP